MRFCFSYGIYSLNENLTKERFNKNLKHFLKNYQNLNFSTHELNGEIIFEGILNTNNFNTADQFTNNFVDFVENNKWYCGGGISPENI